MPQYDFKTLSPYDFELLVRDALQAETHRFFESFKRGKDEGVDLRYSSDANKNCVVQAKHYVESGYKVLLRHLRIEELPKIKKLAPTEYILVTSVDLSKHQKDELLALLHSATTRTVVVHGASDLNNILTNHPTVERAHFKLWLSSSEVLERVLHADVFNRTAVEIEEIRQKMRVYVEHTGFESASNMLERNRVCIISGQPGIGKTTLAEMLIVAHISNGYTIHVIATNMQEAYRVYKPDSDEKALYYFDDFLGQTQLYERSKVSLNGDVLKFIHAIQKQANQRFILTTREYLLQQAKASSDIPVKPDLDIVKFTLDLGHYARSHKAHILFNHLYFSDIPLEYKLSLKHNNTYIKIIDHPNYNPRIIESMTNSVRNLVDSPSAYCKQFLISLNNSETIWGKLFDNNLSELSQYLLFLIFCSGDGISVSDLKSCYQMRLANDDKRQHIVAPPERVIWSALQELDGSFTTSSSRNHGNESDIKITFKNPSVKDFLRERLVNDIDTIEHLLRNIMLSKQCEILFHIISAFSDKELRSRLWPVLLSAYARCRQHEVPKQWNDDRSEWVTRILKISEELIDERELWITRAWTYLSDDIQTSSISNIGSYNGLVQLFNRLFTPLLFSLKKRILDNASELEDFELYISIRDMFPLIIKENDEDAIANSFSDNFRLEHYLSNLDGEDPYEYRKLVNRIENIGYNIRISIKEIVDAVNRKAEDVEREWYEAEEIAAERSIDAQPIVRETSSNNISDINIRAMFDLLDIEDVLDDPFSD